jgi:hypothetical protein
MKSGFPPTKIFEHCLLLPCSLPMPAALVCSSHPLPKDPTFLSLAPWSPTHPPPKAPSFLPPMAAAFTVAFVVFLAALPWPTEAAIGVNWGTVSAHRMPAPLIVELMRANGIAKVKLFDADPAVLRALVGSGLEVMLGIRNEALASIAASPAAADAWVAQNVSRYVRSGAGVDIRYGELLSPFRWALGFYFAFSKSLIVPYPIFYFDCMA